MGKHSRTEDRSEFDWGFEESATKSATAGSWEDEPQEWEAQRRGRASSALRAVLFGVIAVVCFFLSLNVLLPASDGGAVFTGGVIGLLVIGGILLFLALTSLWDLIKGPDAK